MPHYVILANFTEQGVKGVKDTGKRAKAFRDTAKQMGVTVKDIFWTMGTCDVVVTMEGPSDEAVASLMLKMSALGNLKSQTLRAFPESQIDSIVSKI